MFWIAIIILLGIGFIVWQFRLLQKYVLTYDKFQINLQERWVSVNGQTVYFQDIDHVTVKQLRQPALFEKALSKNAAYSYMSEIVFHLKEGPEVHCTFNFKGALYKALKQLEPFVSIQADIESYKPRIQWGGLLLVIAAIILAWMLRS